MSDYGVKETQCTRCGHREVCSLKTEFLEAQKAIVDEMKRKFLTKTARSQSQSISFFRDPFKLVPVNDIAEIADKFTRNEIMTSNEIRQVIGMKPSDDPRADELRNKNLSAPSESEPEINPPVEDENVETE